MKKTFQLRPEGKNPDRVLEAIKHEVRKYVKRERRKARPAGVDFWDFDCRVGAGTTPPEVKHLAEVIPAIDAAAASEGAETVYVEILAKPGHRLKKIVVAAVGEPVENTIIDPQSGEESTPD